MLVFTRQPGDQVVIKPPGHPAIVLTVVAIPTGEGKVRLGFETDPATAIHRGEVWESIQRGEAIQSGRPIDIRKHAEAGGLCGLVAKV